MLNRTLLVFALLAGSAWHVVAEPMYKCGNTYSQTPCAPDAAVARVSSGAAPDEAPGAAGYELCVATAKKSVDSAQPDATRVGAVGQKKVEVIQYAGKPVAAHRHDLNVDVITLHGNYAGARQYACWLSEDQRRVLQFASAESRSRPVNASTSLAR